MTLREPMAIRARGDTDKGRKSSRNEDFYIIDTEKHLYLLADGMGAYHFGEVASRAACELYSLFFDTGAEDLEAHMKETLVKVNSHLYNQGAAREESRKLGSTFLACLVAGGRVHLCHAGDVRAYLFRGSQLRQLTRDHSTVAEMVALGYLSPQDALSHPLRHIVNRSLGTGPGITPDYNRLDLEDNDTLLLCSDGLWHRLEDEVIRETLEKSEIPGESVAELIHRANQAGGEDNITVIVITVSGKKTTSPGPEKRKTSKRRKQ
jgi:PPM family protein phosphatase